MSTRPSRRAAALPTIFLALCAVAGASCGPSDPAARILEQRARWNVTILNFSQSESGTINIGARLSGPPNSSLKMLTVRIQLSDADGALIDNVWHTFDLADVERGGPVDRFIRVPNVGRDVAGAGVDMVLEPTADEREQIEELRSASSPG